MSKEYILRSNSIDGQSAEQVIKFLWHHVLKDNRRSKLLRELQNNKEIEEHELVLRFKNEKLLIHFSDLPVSQVNWKRVRRTLGLLVQRKLKKLPKRTCIHQTNGTGLMEFETEEETQLVLQYLKAKNNLYGTNYQVYQE